MFYSLYNTRTKEYSYCKWREYTKSGNVPPRYCMYIQDEGWEIIGIHNTERKAIYNTLDTKTKKT